MLGKRSIAARARLAGSARREGLDRDRRSVVRDPGDLVAKRHASGIDLFDRQRLGRPYERGDDETGPYQSPMEDGMQHFHEWYRRAMAGG